MQQGMEQGMQQGMEQGMQQGRHEGRQEIIDLLKSGKSLEQILNEYEGA